MTVSYQFQTVVEVHILDTESDLSFKRKSRDSTFYFMYILRCRIIMYYNNTISTRVKYLTTKRAKKVSSL